MCEILFFVTDKVSEDPYVDAMCFKRGDVITVQENGHRWGSEELSDPRWRILRLTNVSVEDAQAFIAPEMEDDPANPNKMRRIREFKLDIDNSMLTVSVKNWLSDDKRTTSMRSLTFSLENVMTKLKKKKDKMPDPGIIG